MSYIHPSGFIPSTDVFGVAFYTFLLGAFTFVVGLAWNSAIQATINRFVKVKNSFWFKYLYALLLTVFAVIIIFYIAKIFHQKITTFK